MTSIYLAFSSSREVVLREPMHGDPVCLYELMQVVASTANRMLKVSPAAHDVSIFVIDPNNAHAPLAFNPRILGYTGELPSGVTPDKGDVLMVGFLDHGRLAMSASDLYDDLIGPLLVGLDKANNLLNEWCHGNKISPVVVIDRLIQKSKEHARANRLPSMSDSMDSPLMLEAMASVRSAIYGGTEAQAQDADPMVEGFANAFRTLVVPEGFPTSKGILKAWRAIDKAEAQRIAKGMPMPRGMTLRPRPSWTKPGALPKDVPDTFPGDE